MTKANTLGAANVDVRSMGRTTNLDGLASVALLLHGRAGEPDARQTGSGEATNFGSPSPTSGGASGAAPRVQRVRTAKVRSPGDPWHGNDRWRTKNAMSNKVRKKARNAAQASVKKRMERRRLRDAVGSGGTSPSGIRLSIVRAIFLTFFSMVVAGHAAGGRVIPGSSARPPSSLSASTPVDRLQRSGGPTDEEGRKLDFAAYGEVADAPFPVMLVLMPISFVRRGEG